MFGGGGGNQNAVPPFITRQNQSLFDADSSTQLQLFGNFPSRIEHGSGNYVIADLFQSPSKRLRQGEDFLGHQNNLQSSLNYLSRGEPDMLTRVRNPHPVSTGLRLSYDDDEYNSTVTSSCSGGVSSLPLFMFLGENMKNEFESQTEEVNRYLRVQEEQLMKGMRELKKRHMAYFVSLVEESLSKKLRHKEEELEDLKTRSLELTEKIKQVSMETQNWQYKARFYESVVSVLTNNLKLAIAQGSNGREGCGDSEVDDAASAYGGEEAKRMNMTCRACQRGEITVVLLPCRHLCLCKDCGGSVQVCPVCHTEKTIAVPAIIS